MKSPDPIDVHVGERLRLRRQLSGMSQQTLASGVALTFQQIQKYEKGTNRIAPSRLQHFATLLGVPVSYFFEQTPKSAANGQQAPQTADIARAAASQAVMETAEGRALLRAFAAITNDAIRTRIVRLVEALAEDSAGHRAEE